MNWSGQKDRVRRLRVAIVSSFLFFARVMMMMVMTMVVQTWKIFLENVISRIK